MNKLLMSLAAAGAIAAPLGLVAHEGHTHTVLGTVEEVEQDRLEVEDTDGTSVSFTVNDETRILRGKTAVGIESLKEGERVAVESEERDGTQLAKTIRAGDSSEAQVYACPMHADVTSTDPGRCPKCNMFLKPQTE